MSSIYETKRTLSVFMTTPKCPLSFKARLVLSYLGYQAEYNGDPSTKKIIKATGLGEKSVASALAELGEYGLFNGDGQVQQPPGEWFQHKRESEGHWHHQYLFWKMIVRSPDSPLTQIESAIYGFFLHCASTGYRPKWTAWYLATVLGIDHHTAKRAIERLIGDYGLLEDEGGGNITVVIKPQYDGWWQEPSPPVPELSQLPKISLKVLEERPAPPLPTRYKTEDELRTWIKGLARRWSAEEVDALVKVLAAQPHRTHASDLKIYNALWQPLAKLPYALKIAEGLPEFEESLRA